MKRRSLTLLSAAAALALGVTACSSVFGETGSGNGGSASSNDKGTVSLEVLTSGLATVLQAVAQKVNAYQHEGLTVQVTGVPSGDSAVAVQQLVQGRVDAAFVDSSSVAALDSSYVAKSQSAPLKAVAATGNVSNIVLSPKIRYTGLSSLRGLTLGISAITSIHRANLDYYLRTHGLSEQQLGVKFAALGASDMPSALASGQIDGFIHSEPTTTIATAKDHAQLALSMGGAVRQATSNVIAVRAEYLKSHRSQVKKLVAALQYATKQYQSMPESQIVGIWANYAHATTQRMKEVFEQKDHYNPGLEPLRSAADAYWQVGVPAMKSEHLVTSALTENDMFDFSYSQG